MATNVRTITLKNKALVLRLETVRFISASTFFLRLHSRAVLKRVREVRPDISWVTIPPHY